MLKQVPKYVSTYCNKSFRNEWIWGIFLDAILINIFEFCIRVKAKLHEMMQTDKDFIPEDEYKLNPCQQISIANSLKFIQNPVKCCIHMHYLIQEVNKIIENQRLENTCKGKIFCFHIIIVWFL